MNIDEYLHLVRSKHMNLSDYVKVYDNVLTPDNCNHLINLFESSVEHQVKHDREVYNFTEINTIQAKWDLSFLFQSLMYHKQRYWADTGLLPQHVSLDHTYEEFRMKRYMPEKEQFLPHTDCWDGKSMKRFLVFFWYLTTVDVGGETEFYTRLVMFPATFQYLHAGLTPISSPKYIIGGYLQHKVRG